MMRVSSTSRSAAVAITPCQFPLFGFSVLSGRSGERQEWTRFDASHWARTVPYVALLEPLLGPGFEFFTGKKLETSSGRRPRAAPAQVLVGLSHALRWCAELSVCWAGRKRPGAAAVRDARDLAAASPIRPVRL